MIKAWEAYASRDPQFASIAREIPWQQATQAGEAIAVRRIVRRDGVEVKLSPKDYDLLRLFWIHAGKVLTHALVLRAIWGAHTDARQSARLCPPVRQEIERVPEMPTERR